ncbi:MAG: hypothetical protein D3906_14060, partial [Candidatus Electrothrix sp. AUS1_2]|nr:hypothetical protein [Candidatus Electrothrix sp. AUS1_2]
NYFHAVSPSFLALFFIGSPPVSFPRTICQAGGGNSRFLPTGDREQAISLASSPDRSKILHFFIFVFADTNRA